jgi:nucleoside-diphosphate-sugar epimerase
VDDEVDGIYRLFHSEYTNPVNVGNPNEFTIRELAEIILEETESKSVIEERPMPEDDTKVRRPDITLARELLDWEPKVELREGLRRTIPYFKHLVEEKDAKANPLT